jgi:post-segregation antitoxin (ccd killing protein)
MAETKASRVPEFASLQEAAEFWDTHDSSDFEDEFEEVEMRVSPDMRSLFEVRVRMDLSAGRRLMALARERGVSVAELAAAWIAAELERAEAAAGSGESRPDADAGTRG